MKQTAVQFLVETVNKKGLVGLFTSEEIQQAQEMEKEQRENLFKQERFTAINFAKWFADFNGLTYEEKRVSKEHLNNLYEKIIVSNTFTQEWEMQPYYDLAEKYGYMVYSLVVENRHEGVNEHGVPQETLDKMKNRFEIKL